MNVKIQGGGNGTYANTGSCVAVTNYLQHEDLERMKKGEEVQPFFNQFRDYVSAREVTFKIDNNKAKLSRTDAKFYVITVSPSEKELRCMGRTPQERAEALQRYILLLNSIARRTFYDFLYIKNFLPFVLELIYPYP